MKLVKRRKFDEKLCTIPAASTSGNLSHFVVVDDVVIDFCLQCQKCFLIG